MTDGSTPIITYTRLNDKWVNSYNEWIYYMIE